MTTTFSIAIDCRRPQTLIRFWCTALGYQVEAPPAPYDGWNAFWRSIGVPEEELDDESDLGHGIVDPDGHLARIWFQVVPEGKTVKNRLHLDVTVSGGRENPLRVRRERVLAEVARLEGAGAKVVRFLEEDGLDHFAVAMLDPEGNEFDVN